MEEKELSIGALWKKTGKNGDFLTGSIEFEGLKLSFMCFTNKYKNPDRNQPDYLIYKSKPKVGE